MFPVTISAWLRLGKKLTLKSSQEVKVDISSCHPSVRPSLLLLTGAFYIVSVKNTAKGPRGQSSLVITVKVSKTLTKPGRKFSESSVCLSLQFSCQNQSVLNLCSITLIQPTIFPPSRSQTTTNISHVAPSAGRLLHNPPPLHRRPKSIHDHHHSHLLQPPANFIHFSTIA